MVTTTSSPTAPPTLAQQVTAQIPELEKQYPWTAMSVIDPGKGWIWLEARSRDHGLYTSVRISDMGMLPMMAKAAATAVNDVLPSPKKEG